MEFDIRHSEPIAAPIDCRRLMSMSRTAGVQDHETGPRTKLIFRQIKRRLGHVPLSSRIHARDPKLLQLVSGMSKHTAGVTRVPAKLKELAQLKVAAMVGCPL